MIPSTNATTHGKHSPLTSHHFMPVFLLFHEGNVFCLMQNRCWSTHLENIIIICESNVPFRNRGYFINGSGLVPEYLMTFKMFESRFEIIPNRMVALYGT